MPSQTPPNKPQLEIHPSAVVLAAGLGRRFKHKDSKLLQNFQGKPVLWHILSKYLQIKELQQIIIVTGHQSQNIISMLEKHFTPDERQKFTIAHNQNYTQGMFSSVMRGAKNIGDSTTHILMTPADMPAISLETLKYMLNAPNQDPQANTRLCYVPIFGKQIGNPVLLARSVIPMLQAQGSEMDAEAGAITAIRGFIKQDPNTVAFINIKDQGAFFDVDEVKHLGQLNQIYKSKT